MPNNVNGLAEHVEPLLAVTGFLIAALLAIIAWFIKRTVGKLENNVEELWELVRKIQNDYTALKAEHDVRHNAKVQ